MNLDYAMTTTVIAVAAQLQAAIIANLPTIFTVYGAFIAIDVIWRLVVKAFHARDPDWDQPSTVFEDFSDWEDDDTFGHINMR